MNAPMLGVLGCGSYFNPVGVPPAPLTRVVTARLKGKREVAVKRKWRGCLLAARYHLPSTPARSASVGRRMHRVDVEAAARDQPGDQ